MQGAIQFVVQQGTLWRTASRNVGIKSNLSAFFRDRGRGESGPIIEEEDQRSVVFGDSETEKHREEKR